MESIKSGASLQCNSPDHIIVDRDGLASLKALKLISATQALWARGGNPIHERDAPVCGASEIHGRPAASPPAFVLRFG